MPETKNSADDGRIALISEVIPLTMPLVPISEFKANPARFLTSGAVVTNHGRPRARFIPIDADGDEAGGLETAKATLTALYRLQPDDDVAAELAELAASRADDVLGEPR